MIYTNTFVDYPSVGRLRLCGISDQEGYGEIFSHVAQSQSSEYLNFLRLVSRQIDTSGGGGGHFTRWNHGINVNTYGHRV